MSQETANRWESMKTDETRRVEEVLRKEFQQADAYRYNSASIRIRVTDSRFEGKSNEERDDMVEPLLETLPEDTQADIITLLMLTPEERKEFSQRFLTNAEFEDPTPSDL